MKNNPEWKPFLKAVREAEHVPFFDVESPLRGFIDTYPRRLRPAVALALSLAKWYMNSTTTKFYGGCRCCGCCVFYEIECSACPLAPNCVATGIDEIYTRIHRIYTEHFNALPARDRQKVAG